MLDTDQLRSFLAIVDTGSFTRAAERVNKTQSAISMHMRRLEERLNTELFIKQGRGVRLSAQGERLIAHARAMLQAEASALAAIAGKGLTGRVRFGIPDDYAEPFLPDILSRYRAEHPLVEISVVCEASVLLADRVRGRDLDLAIVTDCAAIQDVEVIREEPLAWIGNPTIQLDTDAPAPLALGGPTCQWRMVAESALARAGREARFVLVSNNYAAIAPIVDCGLAITILPIGAVRAGTRILDERDGLPPLPRSRMGIIHSPNNPTRETLALAAVIRAIVGLPRGAPVGSADSRLLQFDEA
jgi:DNA-binding transcriptional LysR family regulator